MSEAIDDPNSFDSFLRMVDRMNGHPWRLPPSYARSGIGWRYFEVTTKGRLRSPVASKNWKSRVLKTATATAKCDLESPCESVPGADHGCGIYYYDHPANLTRYLAGSGWRFPKLPEFVTRNRAIAVGTIHGAHLPTLSVVEGERPASRSKSFEVNALLLISESWPAGEAARVASQLSDRYGVPVTVRRQLTPDTIRHFHSLTKSLLAQKKVKE